MRKRSEAMAETAQPAAQQAGKKDEFFDDGKPRPAPEPATDARASVEPPRYSEERGIRYVRCDCGLKQSFTSAKGKEPGQLECIRCRKALGSEEDADAALTGGQVEATVAKIIADTKPAYVEEKCETCGKPITNTSLGKFWPCGHSPEALAARAKPEFSEKDLAMAKAVYPGPKTPSIADSTPVRAQAPQLGVTTVTQGKMVFTPIPYNTFEVGPFSATVGEDETPESVMEALKVISANAHEEALKQYIERVQKNNDAINQLAKNRGVK